MKLNLYPIKLYFQKFSIGGFFAAGLLLNVYSWLWLWLYIPQELDQLFLHYNILFGVDLIGSYGQAFLVPLSGLIILLLNTIVGWVLYKKDKFIAQVLILMAAIAQVFLAIQSYLLVLLNV